MMVNIRFQSPLLWCLTVGCLAHAAYAATAFVPKSRSSSLATGSSVRGGRNVHGSSARDSHNGHGPQGGGWILRVCNAYAFKTGLDVFHSSRSNATGLWPPPKEAKQLTEEGGPLPFKRCEEFKKVKGLGVGSELVFALSEGLTIGTFIVTSLPDQEASLLQLVIHRHDALTAAAAFTAHVFGPPSSLPEVALMDTFRGHEATQDAPSRLNLREKDVGAWEQVHFGTSITLDPGMYEWQMEGKFMANLQQEQHDELWLGEGGQYTALRVGCHAADGPSYPEELVLFPKDWTVALRGAAVHQKSPSLWALVCVACMAASLNIIIYR